MSAQGIPAIEEIFRNPAISHWLKAALRDALSRDPLDAACDAHLLCQVLEHRSDALLESSIHEAVSA